MRSPRAQRPLRVDVAALLAHFRQTSRLSFRHLAQMSCKSGLNRPWIEFFRPGYDRPFAQANQKFGLLSQLCQRLNEFPTVLLSHQDAAIPIALRPLHPGGVIWSRHHDRHA